MDSPGPPPPPPPIPQNNPRKLGSIATHGIAILLGLIVGVAFMKWVNLPNNAMASAAPVTVETKDPTPTIAEQWGKRANSDANRETEALRLLCNGTCSEWNAASKEVRGLACILFSARVKPTNGDANCFTMANDIMQNVDTFCAENAGDEKLHDFLAFTAAIYARTESIQHPLRNADRPARD